VAHGEIAFVGRPAVNETRRDSSHLRLPRYSYADADYLAKVSRGTSKRWLSGYDYRRNGELVRQPPVTPGVEVAGAVSFVDLIEIVAIGKLKEHGFPLRQIRQIVGTCKSFFQVERPLVTLRFKTGGREIFVSSGGDLTEVGRIKGMRAWNEVLEPFLKDLDYVDEIVSRWWPLGKGNLVVVDPDYGYGLPVIVDSGVRTEIILERFQAGDLEDQIAKDFNIRRIEVERALQFELNRAA
jgi:uncharacterized protein (DUF433 family)